MVFYESLLKHLMCTYEKKYWTLWSSECVFVDLQVRFLGCLW